MEGIVVHRIQIPHRFQKPFSITLKTRQESSRRIHLRCASRYVITAGLALLLGACGGGGGSTDTVSSTSQDNNLVTSNTKLVATPDVASTTQNRSVILNVLANDSGFNEVLPLVTVVTNPANGTLAIRDDGSVVYTPIDGYSGEDSFMYKITDGSNISAIATASVTVSCTNCPNEDKQITLKWNRVPDVLGYVVYFANGLVKNPGRITTVFNKTSMKFEVKKDLDLTPGDYACFWVQSFNPAGVSGLSKPACGIV